MRWILFWLKQFEFGFFKNITLLHVMLDMKKHLLFDFNPFFDKNDLLCFFLEKQSLKSNEYGWY